MTIGKLAPWNWFRNEENLGRRTVPARREEAAWPASPMQMWREIDRVFDDFYRNLGMPAPSGGNGAWFRPSVDIASTDNEYTINVELPGVNEDDINVELVGDTLRVRGEKKQEQEDKGRDYYAVERSYGSFQRVLTLPDDADAEHVAARFKNGVMTITVPRREPVAAKRVEVKTE